MMRHCEVLRSGASETGHRLGNAQWQVIYLLRSKGSTPPDRVNRPFHSTGTKPILIKDYMKVSASSVLALTLTVLCLSGCTKHRDQPPPERHKIVVTTPRSMPITVTQKYVCQIHSRRHIDVRALEKGYLEEIAINEGQEVKQGDVLFKVIPAIYKAKLDAELAAQEVAQMQYDYTKKLTERNVVSVNELSLKKAELAKAHANAELAQAQVNFTTVKAPFDGIVDRLHLQLGSLVQEGDTLTTLSDNSLMWVYFNVPEASYLDYLTELRQHKKSPQVELLLANRQKFSQVGNIAAIEADFNNRTGNIPFRADFPNPDRILRHGQTGTVLIARVMKDAVVIPQRATVLVLNKRYVYVVDKQQVAHQQEIDVENELDDIFVVKKGVAVHDKIVIEGTQWVHDGQKVDFEERKSEQVLAHMKYHAE